MKVTLFWFRRDLRLEDNAGLYFALKNHQNVLPLFIFDRNILDQLRDKRDARLQYIHSSLAVLKEQLKVIGSDLLLRHGNPEAIWTELLNEFEIESVYTNHDIEPYAVDRDQRIGKMLEQRQIPFNTYKDHLIFEKNEIVKDDGLPYAIFTPYSKKWLARFNSEEHEITDVSGKVVAISKYVRPFPSVDFFQNFLQMAGAEQPFLSLEALGFAPSSIIIPQRVIQTDLIRKYSETRDYPAVPGTSRLGVHLRFGTVSVRAVALKASFLNETFLRELIWRDFYSQILYHFPYVAEKSFKKDYEQINWRNNEEEYKKWCEGKTGYPIVDAGMRELNTTGFMHNRVRMITASFLCKHLLIDWRWGEAYFAEKLLDFDLASNNGGWQWAAGCGTDAAPYFRIFSPEEQTKKFDTEKKYIKKWVPEYNSSQYVQPVVDHKMARERCLLTYKLALAK
ncbi:MAG: cryptochrome/photolyase family protein [Saprospiraceae bacterium]